VTLQPHRPVRRLSMVRGVSAVVGLITAYLLLERSHAEEVGGGARIVAEVLRGERVLSPLTWLSFGVLVAALVFSGRDRVPVPEAAPEH
jgi:hypothetical protein